MKLTDYVHQDKLKVWVKWTTDSDNYKSNNSIQLYIYRNQINLHNKKDLQRLPII